MASFSSNNIAIKNKYQGWYGSNSNNNTLKLDFTTARNEFINSLGSNNISNISIDKVTLYLTFGGAGGDRKKSLNISLLNNTTITSSNESVTTAAEAYNSTTYISLTGTNIKNWFSSGTSPYYLTSNDPNPGESDRSFSLNYLSITAAKIEITWSILKSSLTSYPSAITLGTEYTYVPSSSSYYHRINVYIGTTSKYASSITQGSKKITLAISTFGTSFTENQTSLVAKIRLTTFSDSSGSTSLGYNEYSVTLKLPENSSTKPTISSITITPSSSILKNLTQISFKISTSTKFGATITNYKLTFDGKTYSSSTNSFSEIIPKNSGNLSYTVTITDSRGFSNSKTGTVNVLNYYLPSLTNIKAQRCNSSGTITEDGTRIKITAKVNFYGSSASVKIADSSGEKTYTPKNGSSLSHTTSKELSPDSSYSGTITITDSYGQSASYPLFVGSINYLLHFRKNNKSVGIGCAAPSSTTGQVDIAWPVNLQSGLTSVLPVSSGGTGFNSLTSLASHSAFTNKYLDYTKTATINGSLYTSSGFIQANNASARVARIQGFSDHATFSSRDSSGNAKNYLSLYDTYTTLNQPLTVASGGTGATKAADARVNLGTNNASNITTGTLAAARLPFKIAYGSGNVSGNQTLTINYSSTGFTSVPKVVVSYSTTEANWSGDNGALKISSKTTTGAKIVVGGDYNTIRTVDWIAVGV